MKRAALLVLVLCACVACGSGSGTVVVLRPTNPVAANLYIRVSGPAGVTNAFSRLLRQESKGGAAHGLIVAPAAHGPKDCEFTRVIRTDMVSSLQKYAGQKIAVEIFGGSRLAPSVCQALGSSLPGGGTRVYTIPSSAMEPTLHCARPAQGCQGTINDRVLVRLSGAADLQRDDILVFNTPKRAAVECGAGGVFVKRLVGLPGETVREDRHGFFWIRGVHSKSWQKLKEPYVSATARELDTEHFSREWKVPKGEYFMIGDNRSESCDSRSWGAVPARNIIGRVTVVLRGGLRLKPAGMPG